MASSNVALQRVWIDGLFESNCCRYLAAKAIELVKRYDLVVCDKDGGSGLAKQDIGSTQEVTSD
jgi:hypothetical protein